MKALVIRIASVVAKGVEVFLVHISLQSSLFHSNTSECVTSRLMYYRGLGSVFKALNK